MQDHCKDTEEDTGSPTGERAMGTSPLQASALCLGIRCRIMPWEHRATEPGHYGALLDPNTGGEVSQGGRGGQSWDSHGSPGHSSQKGNCSPLGSKRGRARAVRGQEAAQQQPWMRHVLWPGQQPPSE